MDSVRRIEDHLDQPDLDDRAYRVIELPNKLEALLVHDAKTDKASASLCVNVGNFSDDDSMPGMAHAVEHLLFMGTEKYPIENEYSSYLSSHAGYSNAYTAATHTNYFFECSASNDSHQDVGSAAVVADALVNGTKDVEKSPFYGALDRFAQFFVKPLFLESTLDRELRAVDSENKKNLQSDAWRLSQLSKSLANPQHPYHHFSTGNLQTLRDEPEKRGVKIRTAFIEFYDKHYSANRMKLVVLGRESLDELESWVIKLFSEVRNQNLKENRWDEIPLLTEDELSTEIYAKPVMESRVLDLSFPWLDEEENFEVQPSRYISHLIGHEGPGSILAYLKDKGLANELSSGAHTVCPGSGSFDIRIGLTPKGLEQYREIVKVVFQYIGMMKEDPPLEWMHDETINMAQVDFKFKQKSPASRFTSSTSALMQQNLPRRWLLSGTSKHRKFSAKEIVNAMQYLREDNFLLTLVDQNYPGDWDQKEKWYGTDYKVQKMSASFQSDVRRALADSATERPAGLHLPHRNEFIPTRLDVEKLDVKEPSKTPKLIRNDDTVRMWWKKDDTFWVPKANVQITLRNSVTHKSAANHVKTVVFLNLVKDALVEYSYDAEISGLSYQIGASMLGIEMGVHGYNDKMPVLLEKILTTLKTLDMREDRFDVVKERMTRKWKNWDYQQPYTQIGEFTHMLLGKDAGYTPVYAKELANISLKDVQVFAPELLAQIHVEVFAHGNIYRDEVKKIGTLIENILKPQTLHSSGWSERRNMVIPAGSNFNFEHTLADPENINHAIEYYLDCGNYIDTQLRARVGLFAQMTDEPAFDQLRTKEQLGYVVWSGARSSLNTMGYRVLVQSERDPNFLETRINSFLLKFRSQLETMTDEAFEGHKRSYISKRLEKPKNLNSETNRLWTYINCEYFNFFQVDEDVAAVRKLTRQDIQDFYAKYIDPESATRAKLSVHLKARKSSAAIEVDPSEQKNQLIELLGQYMGSEGVDVQMDSLKSQFENVDLTDASGIVPAARSYIATTSMPESQSQPIVQQLEQSLPDLMVALKIKAPVPDEESEGELQTIASKVAAPVIIDNIEVFKAGLEVSQAPKPVMDITQLEDNTSKL